MRASRDAKGRTALELARANGIPEPPPPPPPLDAAAAPKEAGPRAAAPAAAPPPSAAPAEGRAEVEQRSDRIWLAVNSFLVVSCSNTHSFLTRHASFRTHTHQVDKLSELARRVLERREEEEEAT